MVNTLLYQIWGDTIHGKIWKKSYKNNILKISRINEEFKLPDGSYSVSVIQDCFQYIFKKHGEKTDNPSRQDISLDVSKFSCLKRLNYLEAIKVR